MAFSRIDVSIRLRRAVTRNDLSLVRRIVRNHPTFLRNPDYLDKGNTSLHLASKAGFLEIVVRDVFVVCLPVPVLRSRGVKTRPTSRIS